MIFANTIKLFCNNSGLFWKVLLYQMFCLVLVAGVAVACCFPLVSGLVDSGFFSSIGGLVNDCFFNFQLNEIFSNLANILSMFWVEITANSAQFVPLLVLGLVIVVLGGNFVLSMMKIPTMECIYGYMASYSKLGFGGMFVKNLSRSVKFSLARLVVIVPCDIIIFVAFLSLLNLCNIGGMVSIFAPFIIILVITLLLSIRLSLFGCWASSIVVKGDKIWAGLLDSVRSVSKIYKQVLGTMIAITLLVIVINMIAIMFTASVGLFITIPCSVLVFYVCEQVAYFYANGLRFYVDKQQIESPRKIEDFESLSKVKNII